MSVRKKRGAVSVASAAAGDTGSGSGTGRSAKKIKSTDSKSAAASVALDIKTRATTNTSTSGGGAGGSGSGGSNSQTTPCKVGSFGLLSLPPDLLCEIVHVYLTTRIIPPSGSSWYSAAGGASTIDSDISIKKTDSSEQPPQLTAAEMEAASEKAKADAISDRRLVYSLGDLHSLIGVNRQTRRYFMLDSSPLTSTEPEQLVPNPSTSRYRGLGGVVVCQPSLFWSRLCDRAHFLTTELEGDLATACYQHASGGSSGGGSYYRSGRVLEMVNSFDLNHFFDHSGKPLTNKSMTKKSLACSVWHKFYVFNHNLRRANQYHRVRIPPAASYPDRPPDHYIEFAPPVVYTECPKYVAAAPYTPPSVDTADAGGSGSGGSTATATATATSNKPPTLQITPAYQPFNCGSNSPTSNEFIIIHEQFSYRGEFLVSILDVARLSTRTAASPPITHTKNMKDVKNSGGGGGGGGGSKESDSEGDGGTYTGSDDEMGGTESNGAALACSVSIQLTFTRKVHHHQQPRYWATGSRAPKRDLKPPPPSPTAGDSKYDYRSAQQCAVDARDSLPRHTSWAAMFEYPREEEVTSGRYYQLGATTNKKTLRVTIAPPKQPGRPRKPRPAGGKGFSWRGGASDDENDVSAHDKPMWPGLLSLCCDDAGTERRYVVHLYDPEGRDRKDCALTKYSSLLVGYRSNEFRRRFDLCQCWCDDAGMARSRYGPDGREDPRPYGDTFAATASSNAADAILSAVIDSAPKPHSSTVGSGGVWRNPFRPALTVCHDAVVEACYLHDLKRSAEDDKTDTGRDDGSSAAAAASTATGKTGSGGSSHPAATTAVERWMDTQTSRLSRGSPRRGRIQCLRLSWVDAVDDADELATLRRKDF